MIIICNVNHVTKIYNFVIIVHFYCSIRTFIIFINVICQFVLLPVTPIFTSRNCSGKKINIDFLANKIERTIFRKQVNMSLLQKVSTLRKCVSLNGIGALQTAGYHANVSIYGTK